VKRTYLYGNLDVYWGNVNKAAEAMKNPAKFEYAVSFPWGKTPTLEKWEAREVAEAIAADVDEAWDYPETYDLLIWRADAPERVMRVQIDVRVERVYSDGSTKLFEVPA
jgi:hypothetical protein